MMRRLLLGPALALSASCAAEAPEVVRAAVAANFLAAHQELMARFTAGSGIPVVSSAGSSGQLFAQIRNGAPFHVLLSADQERPRLLEQEGAAVPGTSFTYARGRLVLWAPGRDAATSSGPRLLEGARAIAIANPETAPYGAAAVAVLERMGALERLTPRLVRGESVAQVQSFVGSGAADMGFVALSQVVGEPASSYWLVPMELHPPLPQDAVLLKAGVGHAGARAFLEFLKSSEARRIIREHGYTADGADP